MADGLFCLWHHSIISSNYYNRYIRNLGTTCAHGSKCFVSRSIKKCDMLLIGKSYFVCPYVLSDTDRKSTRLNSSHSQISYAVFCLKKKNKKISNNNTLL